ncbi:MAG: hypothetical protein KAG53_06240 [Endozoicomonadaceae bacterium]|nr:hypothetical protein [Endozoicomonadaceae bacterium]
MNRITTSIVILLTILFLASCVTTTPSSTQSGPRSIILKGETYSEASLGKFTSWQCNNYADNTGTLVEVGLFTNQDLNSLGFILYDGSHSGEFTNYKRKGINHRWDWGTGSNGSNYTFIIKPDGTGFFYDFSSTSEGETVTANDIYKCHKL